MKHTQPPTPTPSLQHQLLRPGRPVAFTDFRISNSKEERVGGDVRELRCLATGDMAAVSQLLQDSENFMTSLKSTAGAEWRARGHSCNCN